MAQADQIVGNDTFPAVRADINNNLAALFSNNSGSVAPSPTVAFMDWIDTSGVDPVWRKRNAANNAWIAIGTIIGGSIAFEGTLPSQTGNAGEYLKTDGTTASWEPIQADGKLIRAPQILTSGTSYTTPSNCNSIYVECVGGGGGGCGRPSTATGGSGGGAGAYAAKFFTVTPSTTYTYTIGAGGVVTAAGGDTTFTVGATTVTAGGGGSGPGGFIAAANGGAATGGDLNARGSAGMRLISGIGAGSGGGASFFGGAGAYSNIPGVNGGGGCGQDSSGGGGTAGGNGLIRIWEYS